MELADAAAGTLRKINLPAGHERESARMGGQRCQNEIATLARASHAHSAFLERCGRRRPAVLRDRHDISAAAGLRARHEMHLELRLASGRRQRPNELGIIGRLCDRRLDGIGDVLEIFFAETKEKHVRKIGAEAGLGGRLMRASPFSLRAPSSALLPCQYSPRQQVRCGCWAARRAGPRGVTSCIGKAATMGGNALAACPRRQCPP